MRWPQVGDFGWPPGPIAPTSASTRASPTPKRRSRSPTTAANRDGSPRTSRAGTRIARSEFALTSSRIGCRVTTSRLAYQSPSAVVDSQSDTSMAERYRSTFFVPRSTTITCLGLLTGRRAASAAVRKCRPAHAVVRWRRPSSGTQLWIAASWCSSLSRLSPLLAKILPEHQNPVCQKASPPRSKPRQPA